MARTRRRTTIGVAVLALLLSLPMLLGGGSAASASSPGVNTLPGGVTAPRLGEEVTAGKIYTQTVRFDTAFNTHVYVIRVANGGNRITADTQDCCLAGDHWGVFLMRYGGTPTGVSNPNAANCGTGAADQFSGAATLSGTYLGGKSVQLILTHCSGVSRFPADLTVRITSNVNISVAQRT